MKKLVLTLFLLPSLLFCSLHEEYVQKFAINLFSHQTHKAWETIEMWEKDEPQIQQGSTNLRYLILVMEMDHLFGTYHFDELLLEIVNDHYSYHLVKEVKDQFEIAWNLYYIQGEILFELEGNAS